MDRRSWLWRRRSSEKSISGEAESSGSGSSHSERFSGDQALLYHNAQSPEVTSKGGEEEDVTDSHACLSEKLSEALVNIKEKEDLVKQHEKIAEEAVSGWEKAENEVVSLRQQIEILTQKNSVLDEALKACLRQLRQAREEQEQKIFDAIAQKSIEWESTKYELESQVVELQSQLHHNTSEASPDPDIHSKLEVAEKEISILISRLKLITRERDLSSQAAETASKQRLDSIKKVARLEAECRRLKAIAHRATKATDNRSVSSIYVESLTDSQSDSGERLSGIDGDNCRIDYGVDCLPGNVDSWEFASKAESDKYKKEKPSVSTYMSSSLEINLMDDFLEMERLAALPQMQSKIQTSSLAQGRESSLKDELESMISRTAELEEKLKMVEVEKMKLETSLNECENQLKTSKFEFEQTESKLEALKNKLVMETEARKSVEETNARLKTSNEHIEEMEIHIAELQTLLAITSEGKHNAELELESTRMKLGKSTEYLEKVEVKLVELQSQLASTNEAKLVAEMEVIAINRTLQDSLNRVEELQNQLAISKETKGMVERELEAVNIKLDKSSENLGDMKAYTEHLQNQLENVNEGKSKAEVETETATKRKDIAESELIATEVEMQTLLSKIIVLEDEVQRHRALADEAVDRCKNLEVQISRYRHQKTANFGELKINQDEELAKAANKFADCQKTIASLNQQLKSLATIEDFFID